MRVELALGLITVVYTVCVFAVSSAVGLSEQVSLWLYSEAVFMVSFLVIFSAAILRVLYIMLALRPVRLTRFILADFRNFLCGEQRLLRALPVLLLFLVFISVFTSYKAMIPELQPFVWDETFIAWDRILHGGHDPWRLLQPLLGYPELSGALNVVYNAWFPAMFTVLYWQLFSLSRPQLRARFLLSFFLTWILLGSLVATLLSSAGPCFLEPLFGNNYYQPLMSYLQQAAQQAPVWALDTQAMLLRSHLGSESGLGAGISAMPSLHVATALLIALTCWGSGRWLRGFGLLFLLLILLGSVHLGWHYAVDGYLAIALTLPIWWGCGWLAQRLVPSSENFVQSSLKSHS